MNLYTHGVRLCAFRADESKGFNTSLRRSLTTLLGVLALLSSCWAGAAGASAKQKINVRLDPSLDSPIVAVLSKNESVDVIGADGEFTQVRTQSGKVGFLKGKYLNLSAPALVKTAESTPPTMAPLAPAPLLVAQAETVPSDAAPAVSPPQTEPAASADDDGVSRIDTVEVTGSRIQRADYTSMTPTATVTRDQIERNADVTLDTFFNTLPQVNPAGTTVSNNPPNDGQSNIDLRGLGANRNIILIDGRRPMVSASDLTVDLNTIPQALIDRVEIVTGGAGAVYGTDAVAGAVNVILKKDFTGLDLHASYADSSRDDAIERQFSGVLGGNFENGRGNATIGFDYAFRESLIKSQRDFSSVATATTSFFPEGRYFTGGNGPTQAAVDQVFATYGVAAGRALPGTIAFNTDGTLFSFGVFNNPLNVENFRYPVDSAVNSRLFPDAYSYNFDAVNLLVLPLDRRSLLGKANYVLDGDVEVFGSLGWTNYTAATALAPTPVPTVVTTAPGENSGQEATSALIAPGRSIANNLVVPTTNPFIPADFETLLASRTGDNANLVGSGATEAFLMRHRTLSVGLRQSFFDNTVVQGMVGAKGPLHFKNWKWEASLSEGRTKIIETQFGNIDTQRLQSLLEAADGGDSLCEGGFNPFGRNPLSAECVEFLEVRASSSIELTQQIGQAFVTGDIVELPAGAVSGALGVEYRGFEYASDPGAVSGPISGFTVEVPASGRNSFTDYFAEVFVPILRGDAPWAKSLDLTVGLRQSSSEFRDRVQNLEGGGSDDNTFKVELGWQPFDPATVRFSYQRAVRAPNFFELFDGGNSAPQYFDPCSATTVARRGANAAALEALCDATGVDDTTNFVQTPGTQASIDFTRNPNLDPETADTFSLGLVFVSPWDGALKRIKGSIDYYNISIDDAILLKSPNQVIANCYNYYGNNPTYNADFGDCAAVVRAGGDIFFLANPDDPDGFYPSLNGGTIDTSGFDVQLDYGFDLEWLGAPSAAGSVNVNLLATYLLEFEQQDDPSLPALDYAGSVGFFGEGLGLSSSFPEYKINLNTVYTVGSFAADLRMRHIADMENRASVIFPGETDATGTSSITYWDLGASWQATSKFRFRAGVNNVFDKQPPVYAPNVQSGTDPSLFDVIGRRFFVQLNMQFQ